MADIREQNTVPGKEYTAVALVAWRMAQGEWKDTPYVKRMVRFVRAFFPDERIVGAPDALPRWLRDTGFAPWPKDFCSPRVVLNIAEEARVIAENPQVTPRTTHERCDAKEGLRLFHALLSSLKDNVANAGAADLFVALYFVVLVFWHDMARTFPSEEVTEHVYVPPDVLLVPSPMGLLLRLHEACVQLPFDILSNGNGMYQNLAATDRLYEWCVDRTKARGFMQAPAWAVSLREAVYKRLAKFGSADGDLVLPDNANFEQWLQALWPAPMGNELHPVLATLLRGVPSDGGDALQAFVHLVNLARTGDGVAEPPSLPAAKNAGAICIQSSTGKCRPVLASLTPERATGGAVALVPRALPASPPVSEDKLELDRLASARKIAALQSQLRMANRRLHGSPQAGTRLPQSFSESAKARTTQRRLRFQSEERVLKLDESGKPTLVAFSQVAVDVFTGVCAAPGDMDVTQDDTGPAGAAAITQQ